jgi:hypothetical protein
METGRPVMGRGGLGTGARRVMARNVLLWGARPCSRQGDLGGVLGRGLDGQIHGAASVGGH